MCSGGVLWRAVLFSGMLSVLACSGVFLRVLVCSGVFCGVLGCLWYVECSGVFWRVLACSGVFWGCSVAFWAGLWYVSGAGDVGGGVARAGGCLVSMRTCGECLGSAAVSGV